MIQNYGDLKAAIVDWLKIDGLEDKVDTFVALAEMKIFRGAFLETGVHVSGLRCALNERVATWGAEKGSELGVPTDYLEAKTLIAGGRVLRRAQLEEVIRRRADGGAGAPAMYARAAGEFLLWPVPDATFDYDLVYYADRSGLLVNDTDTTQILVSAPDLYLYGACLEAAPYMHNDARIPIWRAQFISALESLNRMDDREEISGGSMVTSLPYGGT